MEIREPLEEPQGAGAVSKIAQQVEAGAVSTSEKPRAEVPKDEDFDAMMARIASLELMEEQGEEAPDKGQTLPIESLETTSDDGKVKSSSQSSSENSQGIVRPSKQESTGTRDHSTKASPLARGFFGKATKQHAAEVEVAQLSQSKVQLKKQVLVQIVNRL